MIDPERLSVYLNTLEEPVSSELLGLEQEALAQGVPIIRKATRQFLRFLLLKEQPETLLEIGTAVGFSSRFMKSVLPELSIDTIENYEPRLILARKNLAHTGIRLLEGDVTELLPGLTGPYDMIFLDGPKGQYPALLPELRRLLAEDGILVTDNVLQEGSILEPRSLIRQRDRTIYDRMRNFLQTLYGPQWNSAVLPIGDGIAISMKR